MLMSTVYVMLIAKYFVKYYTDVMSICFTDFNLKINIC